jgi:hypothetical protein
MENNSEVGDYNNREMTPQESTYTIISAVKTRSFTVESNESRVVIGIT